MGDARGRWEGNTLVVESTNFKDRSTYRNANAATLRLVERFTRTSPDKVEWSVTVNDPEHVDAAVDILNALDEDRSRARAGVRVPRRQLRGAAYSQRRPRSRARVSEVE